MSSSKTVLDPKMNRETNDIFNTNNNLVEAT